MFLSEIYDAKSMAIYHKENPYNNVPYLLNAFFPDDKKMGLDLKWIKTSNGLPVSLSPSNFDAKATIRTRKGVEFDKQEMAFFRESMMVSEKDQQEIMRVLESSDPYAQQVLKNIYNDVETLVNGAKVVPERMRAQLLFPQSGGPAIYLSSNNQTWAYNFDFDGKWAENNRVDLSGIKLWSNAKTAKPLNNIRDIVRKAAKKGVTLRYMILSQSTFDLIVECDQVKSTFYTNLNQNVTANTFIDDEAVKNMIKKKFKLEVLIYDKQVKTEDGTDLQLVPDGYISFLPEGTVGKTWFGVTPEERTLMGDPKVDVSVVEKGITVTVNTIAGPPVQTSTTVSMITLPSFEGMDSCYLMYVGTESDSDNENDALTVTVAKGTESGTTKFTVSETLAEGHSYKVKVYESGATLPNYGANLKLWKAYTEGEDFATTSGYEVVIAEVDSEYKCVAATKVVADCNS